MIQVAVYNFMTLAANFFITEYYGRDERFSVWLDLVGRY